MSHVNYKIQVADPLQHIFKIEILLSSGLLWVYNLLSTTNPMAGALNAFKFLMILEFMRLVSSYLMQCVQGKSSMVIATFFS